MSIDLQRVGEVGDGSVTEAKLADNAVDLAGDKITGQLASENLEDGAVVEAKIAALAISTGKLKDNVITLAKADAAMKKHSFLSDNTEVSVTGVTATAVKEYRHIKATDTTKGFAPQEFSIQAEMKTSDAAKQGTMEVYVDAEGTPRMTINTTSESYELLSATADISDLTTGKHEVFIKLKNADAAGTTYNRLLEVFFQK